MSEEVVLVQTGKPVRNVLRRCGTSRDVIREITRATIECAIDVDLVGADLLADEAPLELTSRTGRRDSSTLQRLTAIGAVARFCGAVGIPDEKEILWTEPELSEGIRALVAPDVTVALEVVGVGAEVLRSEQVDGLRCRPGHAPSRG